MRIITLVGGKETLIDEEFYEKVINFPSKNWNWICRHGYAYCQGIYMHNLIKPPPQGLMIDHIDRNPLNNQVANLRFCTYAQNAYNMGISSRNKSGYKGVSLNKRIGKFQAKIVYNGQKIHIGTFSSAKDAAIAYNEMAVKLHGEFAVLNKII